MSRTVKGMKKDATKFVRAVNLKMFTSIIRDTPVDTGRAQGNWQATENTPAQTVIDRFGAEPAVVDAAATLKGLGLYWLSNNLPYIERLEYDGWSQQAPAGMLRKNVARIAQIVGESK